MSKFHTGIFSRETSVGILIVLHLVRVVRSTKPVLGEGATCTSHSKALEQALIDEAKAGLLNETEAQSRSNTQSILDAARAFCGLFSSSFCLPCSQKPEI